MKNQPIYEAIIETLKSAISEKKYLSEKEFIPVLTQLLLGVVSDKKLITKIANGLSEMDKTAEIQKDRKGNVLYDKDTKDTEIIPVEEDIDDYMEREVLPYVPDAKAFWEENLGAKKPVIKTGAEIPFTRTFYKYQAPKASDELKNRFVELEAIVSRSITNLFG